MSTRTKTRPKDITPTPAAPEPDVAAVDDGSVPPLIEVGFARESVWDGIEPRGRKDEEDEAVSAAQEWRAVVASPFTWMVCSAFPLNNIDQHTGGRKRSYPDWMMFFVLIGMPIFGGSARKTVTTLRDPAEWGRFARHVHQYLPEGWTSPLTGLPKSTDPAQDAADRLAGTPMPPPERHHLTYWLFCWRGVPTKGKTPPPGIAEVRRALMKMFRLAAMEQALQEDRFRNDGNFLLYHPDPTACANFDGTVFPFRRTPSSTDENPGMDTNLGMWHTGEGKKVFGSKLVLGSTRSTEYKSRIIFDLQHVPYSPTDPDAVDAESDTAPTSGQPVFKGEQKAVLDILQRALPLAPGLRVVTVDSAQRGEGVSAVQALGPILVNDPHVKSKADPDNNIPEELKSHLVTVITGPACRHEIFYQHGAPHEHTIDEDGNTILTPLEIAEYQRRRNRNGTYRHYHLLDVPCPDGNHSKRIALFHTDATDNNAIHFNKGEYIRVIPPSIELHRKWYGLRNDTEAMHSELKARHMRLPRNSVHQQVLHVLAYAVGQNAVAHAFHLQRAGQRNALNNTA